MCSFQKVYLEQKRDNESFKLTRDYSVVTSWQAEREREWEDKQQPQVRNLH